MKVAIEQADVVVCVLDGSLPPIDADRVAVDLLRRSEKPVVYVANKVDTDAHRADANALYELGLPDFVPISALHGRGTADLAAAVAKRLPPMQDEVPDEDELPRVRSRTPERRHVRGGPLRAKRLVVAARPARRATQSTPAYHGGRSSSSSTRPASGVVRASSGASSS